MIFGVIDVARDEGTRAPMLLGDARCVHSRVYVAAGRCCGHVLVRGGIPCQLYSCITAFACYEDEEMRSSRDKNRQKSCALMPLDADGARAVHDQVRRGGV